MKEKKKNLKKHFEKIKSDQEAAEFLQQDLSDLIDPKNFTHTTFEFSPKDQRVTLRMSKGLLDAVQKKAKSKGIHFQKLIRQALEHFLKNSAL